MKSIPIKLLAAPVLLGLLSAQANAVPERTVIAHPPIHYKSHTPTLKPAGLSPKQVKTAYGLVNVPSKGAGQVIAIVDAYDNPNIESDLAVFSKQFGLRACTTANGCFKKIYTGSTPPDTDSGWAGEIALDVEWAHAMAPAAKILLVEAQSAATTDLYDAIQLAISEGATVVSMSWGGPESPDQTQLDEIFANPSVTFLASSGDSGTGTSFPAASPYVLSVGGTTLNVDSTGNYQSETAWSGSGGGISTVEKWPSSQASLPIPMSNGMRGIPDVAYNADPETGFSVYNTVPGLGGSGWEVVGGTSAGAPQWASLVAVANSAFGSNIGNFASMLYSYANPNTGNYTEYFNPITSGSNGDCGYVCEARYGYNYVTGLGSPLAGHLISMLSNGGHQLDDSTEDNQQQ